VCGYVYVCVLEMLGSCLLIAIVAALYEGLKVIRDCLLRKAWSVSCNGDAVAVPTTDIPTMEPVKLPKTCVRQVIFSFQIYDSGHNALLCLCLSLIGAVEALFFWVVHPWVLHACVRASVQAWILLTWYLTNQWMEFHQTLVDYLVGVIDELIELISFWSSWGQS